MIKSIFSILVLITVLQADFIRDNTNEIVLDTSTNLMWQDNEDVDTTTRNWSDAIAYCEGLSYGGYNDWRLPNFNELYNLADRSISSPAISPVFQNVVSSQYWSSTTFTGNTSNAWFVNFDYGNERWFNKTSTIYVRCVRASDN